MEITPTQRGAIAEAVIMAEATKLGIAVYRPVAEGARADMIFEVGGRLLRVQCKSAQRVGDVITVKARTCRRGPNGYVRGTYAPDEIDLVAVYCAEVERCYGISIAELPPSGCLHLRLSPAKNNQEIGIKWANQYELGAIAQLGERRYGIPKVVGSSPTSSTGSSRPPGRLF